MKSSLIYFFLLIVFSQPDIIYAQGGAEYALQKILTAITKQTDTTETEKIYLQTDKPYYAVNDTLWFKAYLFNAAYLTGSPKSRIVYVEVADGQNQVVKREMVSMSYIGMAWGNIPLYEKEFLPGNYTLRAYTNWMRNFDPHYVFQKQFYVYAPSENDLLISSHFSTKKEGGKERAEINLKLNGINGRPVLLNDFKVDITEGEKIWYKDKTQSSLDGTIDFNFDIPQSAIPRKLAIDLQSLKTGNEAIYKLPVILNRPEFTDLQFMPEGGYLVGGIDARIAFKALSEDGNGVSVLGMVYNSKQQEVLSFQSSHLGIGVFRLNPQPDETYTAKIKLADGVYSKPYPLPPVRPSGIVLSILNGLNDDSLEVNITASSDLQVATTTYYLVAQARGIACYGAFIRLSDKMQRISVSKALFPTGVTRFTLLNERNQALNERIVYIDHHDPLSVHFTGLDRTFKIRDSVGLKIKVTDKAGNPVRASFSVAVTDDKQVTIDRLKKGSILTAILLESDIKGSVEEPGYYFPSVMTSAIWERLDNLLLAQGWVNFDWTSVFLPLKPILYPAESQFTISGKVTNLLNKPAANSTVILMSKKPALVRDTVTNKAGIFSFTNIYPADTAVYFIQSLNKRGKAGSLAIEMDNFKPPLFIGPQKITIPWYMSIDSNRQKTIGNLLAYKAEKEKLTGPHILKEVKIKDQRIIQGSHNLNEGGESDFVITPEELDKAGKVTLGDLLRKNVKGFHFNGQINVIDGRYVQLVIDGVDVDWFFHGGETYTQFIDGYMEYLLAEDVKGIEVMSSTRNVNGYYQRFKDPSVNPPPSSYAFIEITTYSGHGAFFRHQNGTYMFKPIAFSSPAQFYSPLYTQKNSSPVTDIRSTIYWSPDIKTDKNGEAAFSFYTADKPGSYSLVIEGCDMNGNLGSNQKKIFIK